MRRRPLRLQKSFNQYVFKGGSAGFVIVYKNGKRMKLINKSLSFNQRKSKEL